jgi:hypothetical protein
MQNSYSGVQDNISCVLHGVQYLEGHICFWGSTEAWPQGAAQTGIQDGVSQEEGFHVRTS